MKATNIMMVMALALVVLTLPAVSADSPDLDITEVRVNGDEITNDTDLFVERGDELDTRVRLEANEDVSDAQVEVFISGYRYAHYEREMVNDYTRTFNLDEGRTRSFDLGVTVPTHIEREGAQLRIIVSDRNSGEVVSENYQLSIYGVAPENAVEINDYRISPSRDIEPGRALSHTLRVKNLGETDLDDVTATVSIPGLGVEDHETIDSLNADETETFEALLTRIPSDAEPGQYNVNVEVDFDRYESVQASDTITVKEVEEEEPEERTQITVPNAVNLKAGGGDRIVPILIENKGTNSKSYTLSTSDVSEWGKTSFEPSSAVVVEGESSKTVNMKVSANEDAEAGDQVFRVDVSSTDTTKTAEVVASIEAEEETETNVREILEWALVALIVLLIILGIVLLATKLRGNKEEPEEDETQTYY